MSADLNGIKARVELGRKSGGNPEGPDSPFQLYQQALDDLDALIADAEKVAKVAPPLTQAEGNKAQKKAAKAADKAAKAAEKEAKKAATAQAKAAKKLATPARKK